MVAADKALWFESCAADSAVALTMIWLMFGLAVLLAKVVQRWLPSHNNWVFTTALAYFLGAGAIIMSISSVAWPFPPQIVRLSLIGDSVEIKVCRTWSEDVGTYPLKDVDFRYIREERGARRRVHHMLEAQVRSDAQPLGSIEFVPRNRFDFAALGNLAPAALEHYELSQRRRVLD